VRQKQVEHAKEQMEGKELARGVLRETVGKVDYKGVGMEVRTIQRAGRTSDKQ